MPREDTTQNLINYNNINYIVYMRLRILVIYCLNYGFFEKLLDSLDQVYN